MKKYIFVSIIIFTSLLLPSISTNAEEKKLATEPEETLPFCQKPVKTPGPGNVVASIAQLKTIIIWSDIVTTKHGKDFSLWHQAQSKNIKCKKGQGSRYYYCEINAIPCAQKTQNEIDQILESAELEKQKKEQEKEKKKQSKAKTDE